MMQDRGAGGYAQVPASTRRSATRARLAAVLGMLAGGCVPGAIDPGAVDAGGAPPPSATAPLPATGDQEVDAFLVFAARHRQRLGCPPMRVDPSAGRVAAAHSADMRRRGYMGHTSPDGRSPADRLEAAGIRFRALAENVLYGAETGRAAFDQWMRSPAHRRNLENCTYTHHGVGRNGSYWTHVFFLPL